jgi:predicted nucleic acid-binding protein
METLLIHSQCPPVPEDLLCSCEEEAIKLRQYTNLKLPDAIIAATAVKMGAVLLSYDNHFDNLAWPGLTVKKSL